MHHQAHPAGCAGRVPGGCVTVRSGGPPCVGHRHSLLGLAVAVLSAA
ncbi:hypothetical protein BJ965_001961 [Streptomyces luteogriseus]|uniref:Uncharacterized protein n=1 Tax=Streptomyces luteogriseus TaxID=68233 RepID=A0A7W7DL86_9ACTN|nr:hypothetical protein [Streptomyces luteogriseus]